MHLEGEALKMPAKDYLPSLNKSSYCYLYYIFWTLCNGEVKGVAEKGRMPLARLKLRLTTLITVSILYGIATGVNFEENRSGSEPHGSLP